MPITFPANRDYDALVVGRAGMDLYPQPDGTKTHAAGVFHADMGGSAGNTAVALARHGLRVGLWSAFSQDPVGDFARQQLEVYGVDTRYCFAAPEGTRTTLALVENRLEGFESVIYRNNAADFHIQAEQLRPEMLAASRCLIVSGTGLAQEPSRSAIFASLALARAHGCPSVLDIDYRPYSWASRAQEQEVYNQAARNCDIIVGNDEEFAVMAGSPAAGLATARALARDHVQICIYKMGERGALTLHRDGEFATGIFPVQARKPVGAGDAFMGSLMAALLAGADLPIAVRRGSAAAALVVSRFGCAGAMPTSAELEQFLEDNPRCTPPPTLTTTEPS